MHPTIVPTICPCPVGQPTALHRFKTLRVNLSPFQIQSDKSLRFGTAPNSVIASARATVGSQFQKAPLLTASVSAVLAFLTRSERVMPWKCPACHSQIVHAELDAKPRLGILYRCHICRLELVLDPFTGSLSVAPIREDDARDGREKARLMSRPSTEHTSSPTLLPPPLYCLVCDGELKYQHSHLAGVQPREQWDTLQCPRCNHLFEYRPRTRRLRPAPLR